MVGSFSRAAAYLSSRPGRQEISETALWEFSDGLCTYRASIHPSIELWHLGGAGDHLGHGKRGWHGITHDDAGMRTGTTSK